MDASIKRRLRRLRRVHQEATDFLSALESVLGLFAHDSIHRREWPGLAEPEAKEISYLLYCCYSWRASSKPFPPEFSEAQSHRMEPVRSCGETEANAHWLTWVLSQRVLRRLCEAIAPGSTQFREPSDVAKSFHEVAYMDASWRAISDAVYLSHNGAVTMPDGETSRLRAMTEQECAKARAIIVSQAVETQEVVQPARSRKKTAGHPDATAGKGRGRTVSPEVAQRNSDWLKEYERGTDDGVYSSESDFARRYLHKQFKNEFRMVRDALASARDKRKTEPNSSGN